TDVLQAGERVGRYRIEYVLHQSPSSIVYRADHVVLGTPAVIKMARSSDTIELEAEALSLLASPYLPTLYGRGSLGENNTQAYLIAEHVDGPTLAHTLRCHRRLSCLGAIRLAI